MNEQITIGDKTVSFEDFAGKFEEYLLDRPIQAPMQPQPAAFYLLGFLHTYTKNI